MESGELFAFRIVLDPEQAVEQLAKIGDPRAPPGSNGRQIDQQIGGNFAVLEKHDPIGQEDRLLWEAGVEASLFDRCPSLSVAAYKEKLKGFQTSVSYTLPDGTPQRGD